jgi:hypothetical protein
LTTSCVNSGQEPNVLETLSTSIIGGMMWMLLTVVIVIVD